LKYRSGHAARVALSSVALAAMMAAAGNAWALGLGRLNVQSALGETLRAEIDIANITPEEESSLKVRIASPDAYRAQGVEFNSVLQSTQVSVARRPDGRPYLRVTSERAVQEPFVDVIVEITWSSGRLVREFTLLLDPPQSRVAPPVQAAAPVAPQVSAAPPATAMPAPAPAPTAAAPIAPQAAAPSPRPAPASRGTVQPSRAPAATAALPSGPDEYKVREGDTLYRIARQSQRAGVSLDQMLVALFRGNPNAFMGDNMNRLKAGAVLSVPSSDDAKAVTTADAREVIRAQSADFGAYRQRLAGNVPTTKAEDSTRQAKGKVTASVDDSKQAASPTPDKLTLSQGAVKAGATEAKASKEAEKKEADARVAELTRNVEQLKKVQEGAATTATAPAQPAPPAPAMPAPAVEANAPTPPPPAPATPPPAATVAQAPTAEPPKMEAPAMPALPVPAPVASEPVAAPPAPRPAAPKAATPPVQAEEPGLLASLMEHPMAMPGGIGLVVLLVGLAVYRLRGRFRKDNGETSFLESRLQPDSFFGASGGQRVDTRDAASGVSSSMSYSLSQLDAIGDVDPVAEADVYLAYGRDLQAEEILKEAMRGNPDRLAIRTKLLEVYAKRRDTKGFELLATQLYSLTKGEGDDWAKAQELGRGIDPENPLYKPGGAPPASVVGDSGRMIEPLGASTMPQSIMPSTSGFPPSAIDSMSPDTRGGTIPPPDLDLDLDLGTMPRGGRGAETTAKPKPSVDLESISLDLNAPSGPAPLTSGGAAGKPTLDFGDFTLPAQPSGHAPLDENDPLARKLELAEEFRQIGDMEGARDLLEEVVAKAGGALKTKAQSMLDSLA